MLIKEYLSMPCLSKTNLTGLSNSSQLHDFIKVCFVLHCSFCSLSSFYPLHSFIFFQRCLVSLVARIMISEQGSWIFDDVRETLSDPAVNGYVDILFLSPSFSLPSRSLSPSLLLPIIFCVSIICDQIS